MKRFKGIFVPKSICFILIVILGVRGIINHRQIREIQETCSKTQPATVIYKTGNNRAVYVFGECRNYKKKVVLQTASKSANQPNSGKVYQKTKSAKKTSKLRPAPKRVGASRSQQYMIDYSWQASGGDEQFITMIEGESKWQPKVWEIYNDGSKGHGYGLCQVDDRYWPEIVADPKFQSNWAYQVHTCLKLWNKGVTFYGHNRNNEMLTRFWWSPQDNT